MYISRVRLDTSKPSTQRLIKSRWMMHGLVQKMFDGEPYGQDGAGRVVWRIEPSERDHVDMLIVSGDKPNLGVARAHSCDGGAANATKDYTPALHSIRGGQRYRFAFVGNPMRRHTSTPGGKSKRVPCTTDDSRMEWLVGVLGRNGAQLDGPVRHSHEVHNINRGGKSRPLQLVRFEGSLAVSDESAFRDALAAGIGQGKPYGGGLLTIL